ncbi:MAG TPA: type II CAAX endopeptidase family protein [Chthonomonas sp.]|uniref:CPBP family intramembrane glutamic endopeptidase n=1 Tax=Chthonomonas sp. TaxID=2282153 RepID=UPI002B4B1660|nr:type II CAAX endopeptidase family protein [Chthonomonas sp.]HLI50055.1 type II CAAX endopeptidase family protein [Chthonomonas sp.]
MRLPSLLMGLSLCLLLQGVFGLVSARADPKTPFSQPAFPRLHSEDFWYRSFHRCFGEDEKADPYRLLRFLDGATAENALAEREDKEKYRYLLLLEMRAHLELGDYAIAEAIANQLRPFYTNPQGQIPRSEIAFTRLIARGMQNKATAGEYETYLRLYIKDRCLPTLFCAPLWLLLWTILCPHSLSRRTVLSLLSIAILVPLSTVFLEYVLPFVLSCLLFHSYWEGLAVMHNQLIIHLGVGMGFCIWLYIFSLLLRRHWFPSSEASPQTERELSNVPLRPTGRTRRLFAGAFMAFTFVIFLEGFPSLDGNNWLLLFLERFLPFFRAARLGPFMWFNELYVMILGPYFEELFFRATLYRYARKEGGQLFAMVYSSLVFSAYHLDPAAFFGRFWMGLLFAILYELTGDLQASWGLHCFNNFVVEVLR